MQHDLTFISFLESRDPEFFQQILAENHYHEFFKDISGKAKRVIGGLGAALALGGASPKHIDVGLKPAMVKSVVSPDVQEIIDHIKKKTGEDIKPSDVHMIKPSEVISPEYGKDYEKVRDMSGKAQSSPEMIGDIELPRAPSALNMKIGELDKPIPVVFMNPEKYPGTKPGTKGFCIPILGGQKFCIVDSPSNLSTLRHELSHTTQNFNMQSSLSDENPTIKYLTDHSEIGVRLAELKRNWYKKTGQILTKENFGEALKDLMRNPKDYSPDVRQIISVYNFYNQLGQKTNDKSKLIAFVRYMADNIDMVVKGEDGGQDKKDTLNQKYSTNTSIT